MRPQALVALSVGKNAVRDKHNLLHPTAATEIRRALGEVVEQHTDSAVLATAVVGLVSVEQETGRTADASAIYNRFRETRETQDEVLSAVRDGLGELALRIGGMPEFAATTLDGRTLDREAFKGKVAIVDFWATWCGPCLEEMPSLRRIAERHGEDVVLVGVNLNEADELSTEWWRWSGCGPGRRIRKAGGSIEFRKSLR